MKFIALTFDYSIKKLQDIGRSWAVDVYKEKNFIFKYSAASYASFIAHNPDEDLIIFTDDVDYLYNELTKYNINLKNVSIVDWTDELKIHKEHKYAFNPVIQLVQQFKNLDNDLIKLDNDLICKKKFNINLKDNILVWKREGLVCDGNPLWGEIHVCKNTVNNINFMRYNIGVLGLPKSFWNYNEEFLKTCNIMVDTDISSVTDVNSKIYHCCEQTAYNWIFHKYNFNILETYDIFDHYFDKKINCIEAAKKYLKV